MSGEMKTQLIMHDEFLVIKPKISATATTAATRSGEQQQQASSKLKNGENFFDHQCTLEIKSKLDGEFSPPRPSRVKRAAVAMASLERNRKSPNRLLLVNVVSNLKYSVFLFVDFSKKKFIKKTFLL